MSDLVGRNLSGDHGDHGLVAVVVASSTAPGRRLGRRVPAALAHQLAEMGFWSGLPPAQAQAQEREVAAGGYPFNCAVLDDVTFFADGEDLAEGDVERCLILDADDWHGNLPWLLATVRPFAVVNDLLVEAGTPVRVHTLRAGGNDALALLLDPAIVEVVRGSGLVSDRDLPELVRLNRGG